MAFNRRFESGIASLRTPETREADARIELELATRPSSWRAHVVDDDALLNLGPHLVDLARWLTASECRRIRADVRPTRAELEIDMAGGQRAHIACIGDRPYRERVTVVAGTRTVGEYRAGGPRAALRSALTRDDHSLSRSISAQLEAFAAVARGERNDVLASAADGVEVMAVLEAARSSAEQDGAWRDVSASEPPG